MNDLIDDIINDKEFATSVKEYISEFDDTLISVRFFIKKNDRYTAECLKLSVLAHHQLNSDKNKIKPPIEDMSYNDIFDKIDEEYNETRQEFYQNELNIGKIDKRRALEEIGDLAGMLAGLVAKVLKEK